MPERVEPPPEHAERGWHSRRSRPMPDSRPPPDPAELINVLIRYGRVRANVEALRPHLGTPAMKKVGFRIWTLLASIDDLLAPQLLDAEGMLWGAALTQPSPEMVRLARAVLVKAGEMADAG